MNQTEHKTITALMKAIKKDMEAGITQIAVIVEESGEGKSIFIAVHLFGKLREKNDVHS